MANGKSEKCIDAGGGLENSFAQSPAAKVGGLFAGAADVAPEIVKVIFFNVIIQIIILPDITLQTPGAVVLN